MPKVIIENKDGTEEELETVPSYQEKAGNVHEESGLYSVLNDFLDEEGDETDEKDKDKDKDDDPKAKKTEDIEDLLKNSGDSENGKDGAGADDEDSGATGDEGDSQGDTDNKFDELDEKTLRSKAEELNVSLLSKTKEIEKLTTNLTEAQSQLQTLQKDGADDKEVSEFFQGLRKDFVGTIEKYRKKYEIPDNSTLLTQLGGGLTASRNARLKQYIQNELRPKIEKEFELEGGKFVFNKDTAWDDPESASYAFRKGLEAKEDEFDNADVTLKAKEKETSKLIQAQQVEDKKWYAEKYLGNDMDKVEEVVKTLNAIPGRIAKGELKPEDHPLSLRYIMRGYNYETLVKGEVDKAVADLKIQLKDMGVTFPKGQDLPTDITNIKKAEQRKEDKPIKVGQSEFSPMAASIEDTLNN